MSAATHNDLAPAFLKRLIRETSTEAQRLVVVESLLLGLMLYHGRVPSAAGELLDSLSLAVVERMTTATGDRQ